MIGQEVDSYDHKLDIDDSYRNNKTMVQKMNMSMSHFSNSPSNRKNTNFLQNISMNISQEYSMLNSQNNSDEAIENQFLETVAYI